MVREVPSYLLIKLLQAERPHRPQKKHERFFSFMLHVCKLLFD
jgi:hypothetical protein